ncbi:MAG: hypothetical protein HC828_22460 [Blastochloris sp.]|nr:hypothetical protein [Blastochloris sp.]
MLTATLSLTIGALSISRFQTLVQRVNAIESMANVTVLCFDKTGTLTRNHLAVQEIVPLNGMTPTQIQDKLRLYTSNLSTLNRTAAAVAQWANGKEELPLLTPGGGGQITKLREVPFNSTRKWGAVCSPTKR